MGEFHKVAKVADVQSTCGKMVVVAGNEIALFNVDGKIYAIENNCAHQGGPLSEGKLQGKIVTCPYHSWKFDVTTGDCTVVPTANVNTFPTKVENDEIYVKV